MERYEGNYAFCVLGICRDVNSIVW